jgi:branched-chain amino acid transport system permease protein
VLQALLNGLVQGAIYAIVALGYTMVYGILALINFAHGEVLMIGAYAGVVTLAGCAGSGAFESVGFVPCMAAAFAAAMLVAAAYGFSIERIAYRPLRKAPPLSPLISAVGVSIFLQNFVQLSRPGRSAPIYAPTNTEGFQRAFGGEGLRLGSATLTALDAVILAVCVAMMLGLWTFVQRTRTGRAMRATAQDKVMAGLVGVDVDRVISKTFVLGSALAAVAGVLVSLYTTQAKFDMGFMAGLKAFTAAVLGGIGNIPGAMIGGLLLGVVEAFGIQALGAPYKEVYAFVLLLAVLILRPKGIMGERVSEKV